MIHKPLSKEEVILHLYKEKVKSKGKINYFPGDLYNKWSAHPNSNFYIINKKLFNLIRCDNIRVNVFWVETLEDSFIRRRGDPLVSPKLFEKLNNSVIEYDELIYALNNVLIARVVLVPI
jgi:hypothetical protein